MKVHYKLPVVDRIQAAVWEARRLAKTIDYIGLTDQEFVEVAPHVSILLRGSSGPQEGWIMGVKVRKEKQ